MNDPPPTLDYRPKGAAAGERRRAVYRVRNAVLLGVAAFGVIGIYVLATLPPLGRSGEAANRVRCGQNLRLIGVLLDLYADKYGGFPPDFDALAAAYPRDVTDELFCCPSANDEPAPPPYVPGVNLSYALIGPAADDDAINAYCRPGNHGGDGVNLLFGNGTVRFESPRAWPRVVR